MAVCVSTKNNNQFGRLRKALVVLKNVFWDSESAPIETLVDKKCFEIYTRIISVQFSKQRQEEDIFFLKGDENRRKHNKSACTE